MEYLDDKNESSLDNFSKIMNCLETILHIEQHEDVQEQHSINIPFFMTKELPRLIKQVLNLDLILEVDMLFPFLF